MSEYQIVMFRAIDRPLTDKQLQFMDRQSSRAEFTKWDFEVEYHYSSFRGDVMGMLRNGYDICLICSNYGSREIRMRLPGGLPFPKSVWSKYLSIEGLSWTSDKNGKAGILSAEYWPEESSDEVFEFDEYLDAIGKVREILIAGDLRALYLLWLCCCFNAYGDSETLIEPPVPHGLNALPPEAKELLFLFTIDPLLVDAAAIGIPTHKAQASHDQWVQSWLSSIDEARRSEIIQRLLSEDPVALKAELHAEMRGSQKATDWPVTPPARTLDDLLKSCAKLREKENEKQKRAAATKLKRDADKAEKLRQARMKEMKSAPDVWLKKASQLVEARGTDNYREAADILADLREAVGGSEGKTIARQHAAHLVAKYPTLSVLKSSLRKKQLLD